MMLESLTTQLQQALDAPSLLEKQKHPHGSQAQGSQGHRTTDTALSEAHLVLAGREIRKALVAADVHLSVAQVLIGRLQEKVKGKPIYDGLSPSQQLVGHMSEALQELLGGARKPIQYHEDLSQPTVILLFGLQGSGKTTTAGKLARYLKEEEGKNPLLIAADTARPAAMEQLQVLGERVGVPVVRSGEAHGWHLSDDADMLTIAQTGVRYAEKNGHDVVIVDTAGRLQVDDDLMADLLILSRSLTPQESWLVVDAMTGQGAVSVAEAFDTQIGMTGFVMTKLDADARGGALLSVVEMTKKPIVFTGTGEALDALEPFYPDRMASRILGMGDVVSLFEKAQKAFQTEDAQQLHMKLVTGAYHFEDYLHIQRQMQRMGSLDQILGMLPIPGLGKDVTGAMSEGSAKASKRYEVLLQSMTLAERRNPEAFTTDGFATRIQRLAKGCGWTEESVKQELRQFFYSREMMKTMGGMLKPLLGLGKEEAIASEDTPTKTSSVDKASENLLAMMSGGKKGNPSAKKKPSSAGNDPMQALMKAFGLG
jgi:signal recognition particle subunit SRP54